MVVSGRYLLPLESRIFIHVYSRGRGVVRCPFVFPGVFWMTMVLTLAHAFVLSPVMARWGSSA